MTQSSLVTVVASEDNLQLSGCTLAAGRDTVPTPLLSTRRAVSGLFIVEMQPRSWNGNNEGSTMGKLSVWVKNEARRKDLLLKNVEGSEWTSLWSLSGSSNVNPAVIGK